MKKTTLLSLIFLSLPALCWGGSITITNPVAGQDYCLFNPQTINWTKSGAMASTVSIFVMHPNGQSVKRTLAMNAPNNGSYQWDGGVSNPGNYIIKISVAANAQYPDQVSGQSGVFTLKNCNLPDLQVGVIKVTPQNPSEGQTVRFEGNVMNYGNGPAQNPVAFLNVKRPGGLPNKHYRQEMNVTLNRNQGVTFAANFKVPKAGNYKCEFSLDPADMIAELDNSNNRKNWTFGVHGSPDLIVCIDNDKRPPVGGKRNIRAVVKNIGSSNVSGNSTTTLRFYVKQKGSKTYTIPALAAGASHTINRRHAWGRSGTKKISAKISHNRNESNRSNNHVQGSYFVRLPHHDKYAVTQPVKCSTGETFRNWQEFEQRY